MLFAVHIADGVLSPIFLVACTLIAITLLGVSLFRIEQNEIPRIGLLAAAAFVGAQIHLPLGVTSVHLLLNGLIGVILGRRAPLALAISLFLQSFIFAHGGKLALGVNLCVLALPAVFAGWWFCRLRNVITKNKVLSSLAVCVCIYLWFLAIITAIQIVVWRWHRNNPKVWIDEPSFLWIGEPIVLVMLLSVTILSFYLLTRKKHTETFSAGFILGGTTAALTVMLNLLILIFGGLDETRVSAPIVLLSHIPIIAIEALAMGFIVVYLQKVSPDLLNKKA
jgi:cobalt/nickel transport system permease protein